MFEKIVLVTRKTRLQGLIQQFNTLGQARFYLEHSGCDFGDYEREDQAYRHALKQVLAQLRRFDSSLNIQVLDRELVSTYLFCEKDLVLVLGQDGLVANTAKYIGKQPLIGINPDAERFDGVLLPFHPDQANAAVSQVLNGQAHCQEVTLAQARLQDGQRLLAFNDLFIGAKSHVSARYRIRFAGQEASHSSSGIIVSTGAGSTGWLSSVFQMAAAVAQIGGGTPPTPPKLSWDDNRLFYVVREPFQSRHSSVALSAGLIVPGEGLLLESLMPSSGVIFSDGMEADFLRFDSGVKARIEAAPEKARLVVR